MPANSRWDLIRRLRVNYNGLLKVRGNTSHFLETLSLQFDDIKSCLQSSLKTVTCIRLSLPFLPSLPTWTVATASGMVDLQNYEKETTGFLRNLNVSLSHTIPVPRTVSCVTTVGSHMLRKTAVTQAYQPVSRDAQILVMTVVVGSFGTLEHWSLSIAMSYCRTIFL